MELARCIYCAEVFYHREIGFPVPAVRLNTIIVAVVIRMAVIKNRILETFLANNSGLLG